MRARVPDGYPWRTVRCSGAEFVKGEYRPVPPGSEQATAQYIADGLLQAEPEPEPETPAPVKRRRKRAATASEE